MIYKFTLKDSHYDSLAKYSVKNIKKVTLINTIFFDILIFGILLTVFLSVMSLNREINHGTVILNYIFSITFIILFVIFTSILFYKNFIKSALENLKFLTFLDKAKHEDDLELLVEENSLILKSYGYSIEILKSNITKIIEVDNIILVFNKSGTDTLILPKDVIKVEYLK